MPTLQELEAPIDRAIVDAVIEATPEWWRSILLEVTRNEKGGGLEGLEHVISSPEGYKDVVVPTDELFQVTMRLADLFRSHGHIWRKVVYRVDQLSDRKWRYRADFEYTKTQS